MNATEHGQAEPGGRNEAALWRNDTGTLHETSRRTLLHLLKGPYLSGTTHSNLWTALLADEAAIRSRLHDLFLELVIDRDDEFAFVQKVHTDELDVPTALRNEPLTFLDTAMLLTLRQILLASGGEHRVIIGKEEVYEQMQVYRNGDEVTFERNLNSAWGHMKDRYRILHKAADDRVEISPVVKFLIDADRVRELTAIYRNLEPSEQDTAE